MELICKDEEVLDLFIGNNWLTDSIIDKFEIFEIDEILNVNVWLTMRSTSDFDCVLLQFHGCKEYGFYHSDNYAFYNIERHKLFKTKEGFFYVSFAPYNEEEIDEISSNDQDFVLSRNISAYNVVKGGR